MTELMTKPAAHKASQIVIGDMTLLRLLETETMKWCTHQRSKQP